MCKGRQAVSGLHQSGTNSWNEINPALEDGFHSIGSGCAAGTLLL